MDFANTPVADAVVEASDGDFSALLEPLAPTATPYTAIACAWIGSVNSNWR